MKIMSGIPRASWFKRGDTGDKFPLKWVPVISNEAEYITKLN